MKVTVWNTPTPPTAVAETQDTVTALRQLGYRASLRLLPDSTYFTYTNDSRNHAQVIDGGWSADYPSADDFIGKLTCSHFAPGDGQATNLAIWLPTVTPDETDLISHRTGNYQYNPVWGALIDQLWVR